MATLNRSVAGVAWERPADLSNKEVLREMTPSALRAFLKIRELWELRDEDARALLGGMSNGAFYEPRRYTVPSSCLTSLDVNGQEAATNSGKQKRPRDATF